MKTLKHSAIAAIVGGLAFANVAGAADLAGTVFDPTPNSWQHQYQNMSDAERNLTRDLNSQPRERSQYRAQNGSGGGNGEGTRTRTRTNYADNSSSDSGYGRGYSDRQGSGKGGGGRGRQ